MPSMLGVVSSSHVSSSSGAAILATAPLWLSASTVTPGDQVWVNLGTAGSALDARMGSASYPDSNDPTVLKVNGNKRLYCPGSPRSGFDISHPATINGSLRIRVEFDLASGGHGQQFLFNRWEGFIAPEMSFIFFAISNTGELGMYWRPADDPNGGAFYIESSVPCFSTTPNTRIFAEVEIDLSVTGQSTSTFRTSTDGVTYNVVGTPATHSVSVNKFRESVGPYTIGYGGHTDDRIFTGNVYRVQVWDDGVLIIDIDPELADANTGEKLLTHQGDPITVASTYSTTRPAIVGTDQVVFNIDDFAEIPNHSTLQFGSTQSFSVVMHTSVNTYGAIALSNRVPAGGERGVFLALDSPGVKLVAGVADHTTDSRNVAIVQSDPQVPSIILMVVDRGTQELRVSLNGVWAAPVDISSVGDIGPDYSWLIGKWQGYGIFANMSVRTLSIFNHALSTQEATAVTGFLTGVSA